jgi:hypothetical protein
MQRVKVYRLNTEGTWDDRGTGNVSVEYLEVGLVMRNLLFICLTDFLSLLDACQVIL